MKGPFLYSDVFRSGFEENCIELLAIAYHRAVRDKLVSTDWQENDITAELNELITSNPLRLERNISSNVEHHLLTKKTKRARGFSARLSRIDMCFSTISSNRECRFFMEAKNLKETSASLKKRYITTGIDNFVNKKYTNGCLVGYLLVGRIDNTLAGINGILKSANRSSEILVKRHSPHFEAYFESCHPGVEELRHFIFDFTTCPP